MLPTDRVIDGNCLGVKRRIGGPHERNTDRTTIHAGFATKKTRT